MPPSLPEDDAIVKGVMLTRGGVVVHANFAQEAPASTTAAAEPVRVQPANGAGTAGGATPPSPNPGAAGEATPEHGLVEAPVPAGAHRAQADVETRAEHPLAALPEPDAADGSHTEADGAAAANAVEPAVSAGAYPGTADTDGDLPGGTARTRADPVPCAPMAAMTVRPGMVPRPLCRRWSASIAPRSTMARRPRRRRSLPPPLSRPSPPTRRPPNHHGRQQRRRAAGYCERKRVLAA